VQFVDKTGFAIGTGRCGTLFLHQVIGLEPEVASAHERNPENEAFHRYCKWHGLPIDNEGFLAIKEREIRDDLARRSFSFEASPYVSLSVLELHERFGARFVLLLRRPDGVVTSFAHKGFYQRPYRVANPDLAAGYQDQSPERSFTFFARISPRGEIFRTWNDMTQVGKVAWFWRAFNERTLEALQRLPPDSYRVVRIEDLGYGEYIDLCSFLGFTAKAPQARFEALRASRPHAFWHKRNVDEWSAQEVREFEEQVALLAERFGYRYRVADLVEDARVEREASIRLGRIPPPRKVRFWRLRTAASKWLRQLAATVEAS